MTRIRTRMQQVLHRCVAVLVVVGCTLFVGAALAPSASAAAPAPASASGQSAAVTVASAAATRYGDWCGPGHDNWKSWWIPDHWFKASFTASCRAHDKCYAKGSHTSRKACDATLQARMKANCRSAYGFGVKRASCYAVASTYHFAVRHWAKKSYKGSGSKA
jgi:hypothetical protein